MGILAIRLLTLTTLKTLGTFSFLHCLCTELTGRPFRILKIGSKILQYGHKRPVEGRQEAASTEM